jgi:hypothetical protein
VFPFLSTEKLIAMLWFTIKHDSYCILFIYKGNCASTPVPSLDPFCFI